MLRAHHFIANIISKSSAVPDIVCLFWLFYLFFLLWHIFLHLLLNSHILYILKAGGLLIVTYTSKEVLPNRVHLLIQDRLFRVIFFLSTFDIEKLRKVNISAVDSTGKNALK